MAIDQGIRTKDINMCSENKNSYLVVLEVSLLLSMLISIKLRIFALGHFALLIAVWITLVDVKRLIPFFFLASLATDLFVGVFGGGLPRAFELLLLIGMLLQNRGKVRLFDLGALAFICGAVTVSFILSETRSLLYFMSVILDVAAVLIMVNLNLSSNALKTLFKRICRIFSIFLLFACVYMITDPYLLYRGGKLSISISPFINPNTFSQMIVQILAFMLGCICTRKDLGFSRNQIRWVSVMALVALTLLALSGSRSGYFAALIGLAFMMAFRGSYKRSFGKAVFILLVFLSVFYFVIINIPALEDKLNIFRLVESGGAGRMAIIEAELKYIIPNHLMFGVGIGTASEIEALSPYFNYRVFSATNIVFSMLTQIGLVGSLAFWQYFFRTFLRIINARNLMPLILIPGLMFIVAISQGIAENIFYERFLWNDIALICVCWKIGDIVSQGLAERVLQL